MTEAINMTYENNVFYCTKNGTKWISIDGEKWYGEEKRIAELENKIADIKANCDLAIEGRDIKIKELELELTVEKDQHQEEVNLHLHAEDYIKSLEQENNKLLDVINNQDVKIADLEEQIEKMKCCGNCGNKRCTSKYRGNSAYHTQVDGFACAENEDWIMRIKEND